MHTQISDRLMVVGTSHVARQSTKEIKEAFHLFGPDIVAVELDHQRVAALFAPKEQQKSPNPLVLVRQLGLAGTLFALIGKWAQKKFGNIVNIEPGADMKAAVVLARSEKKRILLADRPLTQTLRRMSTHWPRREKLKLVWDLLTAPFRKEMKMSINLDRVPQQELIETVLQHFRGRYPRLYAILVSERDTHLVRVVKAHQARFPDDKVLLVIGAGHLEGVKQRLTT